MAYQRSPVGFLPYPMVGFPDFSMPQLGGNCHNSPIRGELDPPGGGGGNFKSFYPDVWAGVSAVYPLWHVPTAMKIDP